MCRCLANAGLPAGRCSLLHRSGKEGKEEKDTKEEGSSAMWPLICKFHLGLQCAQEEIDKIFRLFDVEGKGHIASS